jgi:transient receptor potential cation channel subfamily M protein 2
MVTHWMHEKEPSVMITVTGGATNFHIQSHIRDAFAKGLEKMTTKSNAWVTTGGQWRGVMKLVGQALRDCYDDEGNHVPCIGFCQWGFIRNKEELVTNGMKTVKYKFMDSGPDMKSSVALDPNHTHFIMVDDGTEGQEYGEYTLYNDIKEALGKRYKVPLVTILLGGNRGGLKNVSLTLGKNLPVVLMKGSGRIADLLVFLIQDLLKRKESVFSLKTEIKCHVGDVFGWEHPHFNIFVADLMSCLTMLRQKEKERSLDSLITVFDASDDRATGLGLDFTVLKLLIAHGMDI